MAQVSSRRTLWTSPLVLASASFSKMLMVAVSSATTARGPKLSYRIRPPSPSRWISRTRPVRYRRTTLSIVTTTGTGGTSRSGSELPASTTYAPWRPLVPFESMAKSGVGAGSYASQGFGTSHQTPCRPRRQLSVCTGDHCGKELRLRAHEQVRSMVLGSECRTRVRHLAEPLERARQGVSIVVNHD